MTPQRFNEITARYARLRVAVAGDFCLDRYLEIDPARTEISIETGLPVYNVVHVRSQPGAAGTILNNLVAVGIGQLFPIGFCGFDGEGFELHAALEAKRGVRMDYFLRTAERRTFTYCKPLVVEPGKVPRELNRLDSKNWSPTPLAVSTQLAAALESVASRVDALILLDQVDTADTGVITAPLLQAVDQVARAYPHLVILADSRRSLAGYPPVCLKMNAVELSKLTGIGAGETLETVGQTALTLAQSRGRPVFVSLSERGIIGALPTGVVEHVPSLPLRGAIDIVGAGDAVTANLVAALASGASLREALELAMTAASIVVHQLGTTGVSTILQQRDLVCPEAS